MPCQLNEEIMVHDSDGAAASEDPRTSTLDVPADEGLASPARTRKQSMDAEPTSNDLLQYVKGMFESSKQQMESLEARFSQSEQRMDIVEKKYLDRELHNSKPRPDVGGL